MLSRSSFVGSLVVSVLGAALVGQSLPRFHAFTIEDTGIDWTVTTVHGMNSRGSITATYHPSAGGNAFVRYSDGTVRSLSPLQLAYTGDAYGPQIDDGDRVLAVRSVQLSSGAWIGRAVLVYPGGNTLDIPPYSESLWNEVSTYYSAACLGPGGHVMSGQSWHYDLSGNLVWRLPGYGYFSGLGGGTTLNQLTGLPPGSPFTLRSTRANRQGAWGVVLRLPQGDFLYRMSGSGAHSLLGSIAAGEIDGTNIWQFNDNDELVCGKYDSSVGRYGAAVLQSSGRFRFLNSKASGTPFVNLDGAGANVTPSPIVLGYRYTQSLRTQAFAMLNGLLLDTTGYRLTDPNGGGGHINDAGQVLAMGYTPSGASRWLLLHPQPAPVLAIDIPRSRRNAAARQELLPSSGNLEVRIVGGEPGQPTALFVRIGGQLGYIDGTLGVFDAEQTHSFNLSLPAYLRGLQFDLVAGALDNTFGILQSLDLRVTVM